jgi:hypothetical protein
MAISSVMESPQLPEMTDKVFYLAIVPIIHMGRTNFGETEEALTLFPSREFATEFFPHEVRGYVAAFESSAKKFLTGLHVAGYDVQILPTQNGRVVVRVVQHVQC